MTPLTDGTSEGLIKEIGVMSLKLLCLFLIAKQMSRGMSGVFENVPATPGSTVVDNSYSVSPM